MKGSEQAMENPGQTVETSGTILQEDSGAKATSSSFGYLYGKEELAFTGLFQDNFIYIMYSSFQTCEVSIL